MPTSLNHFLCQRDEAERKPEEVFRSLREERRDLYDLLYGDDYDDMQACSDKKKAKASDDGRGGDVVGVINGRRGPVNFDAEELQRRNNNLDTSATRKFTAIDLGLGDEDLDDFDPYGLDDF